MKHFLRFTIALVMGIIAIGFQSCGGHPEINVEKISDYASKIDSFEDDYDIKADDTDGIVGQYQAVVDKIEEYGKERVWKELDREYPGKSNIIQRFAFEMQGIAEKQKHNLENKDGLVWSDVKKLPFTSAQVNEIIAQSERIEALH